jgi:hypothetical protein
VSVLNKDEISPQRRWRAVWIVFWTERLNLKILPLLLAVSALIGNAYGREGRKAINPPDELTNLSLSQVIAAALEHNPMIQSVRAKWLAARERIPQAGAWEDLKLGTTSVLGRFVSVPANALYVLPGSQRLSSCTCRIGVSRRLESEDFGEG